ncbi:glycosyltransferase family 90 protein [Aplosporella prunicola CBS 121167]|uniref:Glycosyltransferase family 90 protein n=1 Tax=Aplosporella prunicola CBS 121167 TaxID=1176127 RepID=A0A6A6B8F3_9PEZI|nr:glycosyltransferase family 90 protein [Aplosporella prunicola CBS 121167]KAF2139484.1 glycosyltransferase family 90 protein [Aplosporella prunicola CBS 121167]
MLYPNATISLTPAHRRWLVGCVASLIAGWLLLHLIFPDRTYWPYAQSPNLKPDEHPISYLIDRAASDFNRLLGSRSTNLKDAAARYRARRGRHPPPGFDAWFKFAADRDAIIVEEFFDQIYHDLEPFWSIPARDIRITTAAPSDDPTLKIRDGVATAWVARRGPTAWRADTWSDLVNSITESEDVPDVNMPLNTMDESRLLVPWEDVNRMMKAASTEHHIPLDLVDVIDHFQNATSVDVDEFPKIEWSRDASRIWRLYRATCGPDSPARQVPESQELSPDATEYFPSEWPRESYQGYVANWTTASNPCTHAGLRGLHGTFVQPVSVRISKNLVPLFAGSKTSRHNEVIIPAAMYWANQERYSGGDEHGMPWESKTDGLTWRGVASGGHSDESQWTHFHRHRFVSMTNASTVADAETHDGKSLTFRLPSPELYSIMGKEKVSEWIGSWTDTGFIDLLCAAPETNPFCPYLDPYFKPVEKVPMQDQYRYKFLPDIDGNSYSGRYRAFLLSTSLPIKASIYREWHDFRLFPWLHFVPMDNTFIDFYGILDYFLQRDHAAKHIATNGQEWAQQVLRKEDMQIYMYRLILEWARICSDDRQRIGFVKDL